MNKKVIKLTESDLVRIVKKVISEQSATPPRASTPPRPATPRASTPPTPQKTTSPTSFTNKTVNLYRNAQNTNFFKKVTIKSTNKSSNGEVILTIRADGDEYLKFKCSNRTSFKYFDMGEDTSEYAATVYNNNLTTQLAKTFCSRSSGGTSVPKADFATNSSNTGADFA